MKESNDPEYFIDGYLIKHFGIYPIGFDKDNLFHEQKIFLIYLMGITPSQDDWSVQMDYKTKRDDIMEGTSVKIGQADIDLAKYQGKDISVLKKERLIQTKESLLDELNDEFGIKKEIKEVKIEGLPEISEENRNRPERVWEMLKGKGLTNKEKTDE